jgi:cytochrome c oxidase assembly factor CtaG
MLPFAAGVAAHDVEAAVSTPAWVPRWSFEPWVVACLVLGIVAYALGIARLWRHAGRGRGISSRRAASFAGGWALLVVALVSPLDALGAQLFSAHMLQHELLMAAAAPLMVLGRPLAAWAWALPFEARRRVGAGFHHPAWRVPWSWLTAPLAAWGVHAAALWLWHLPSWFEAALASNAIHALQHASFLFSALLFWWAALGSARRSAQGVALLSLFTTMLHTGALGALLSLSPLVWYPSYLSATAQLGLDPLQDQQLGGLVMWMPASLAYLCAGLALAARWIGAPPVQAEAAPSSSSIA